MRSSIVFSVSSLTFSTVSFTFCPNPELIQSIKAGLVGTISTNFTRPVDNLRVTLWITEPRLREHWTISNLHQVGAPEKSNDIRAMAGSIDSYWTSISVVAGEA